MRFYGLFSGEWARERPGVDSLMRRSKRRISPVQFIMLSFLCVILLGTVLLLLPVSQRAGVQA